MSIPNPFTPTFGLTPAVPVGREGVIQAFDDALRAGPGAPARALFLVGTRGVGKTVVLNELEDAAHKQGWVTISETALAGIVDRIVYEHAPRVLRTIDDSLSRRKITGISAAGLGGITTEVSDKHEHRPGLRSVLNDITDILQKKNSGILVTIDEVHLDSASELAAIATAIQHLFREGRNIAVVFAGLPENVDKLLQHPGVTFLRRAVRVDLGAVTPEDVRLGLYKPVTDVDRQWDSAALDSAVMATRGFPFLIQLVGYYSWVRLSKSARQQIEKDHVVWAVEQAQRDLARLVIEPVLKDLPQLEYNFLVALSVGSGPQRTRDIAEELGKGSDTVSHYGRKLIAKHLVYSPQHGFYDYTIPGMREYFSQFDHQNTGPYFW
ncbi:ATP-binding protein [Corynebacterium felinum]|uniref:Orc1-like AAA ATPase domain-containing protein n=1 Tax=Corynebacterium felinum TaxID=131318 RepID=A0ABU2B552_9CORY|nr:ATP-binding protein [Corynebacterium felinum]MDF5821666.1 ATP-binding protein [Corynebacterium felinum]MDR7353742.1 hypothetical protein [Corynebacterium felinum]WJY95921.1 hypothetical protein CFELI_11695 [Corynebacterium felinum]